MQIGIIGSGNIGDTAAHLFTDAGHDVMVSNSRSPESLADFVDELGTNAQAGMPAKAAAFGEVIMEAIPFGAYENLPADALAGTIVISASNYYPKRDGEINFGGLTQTELVPEHLADARVVKAFNTLYWETLRDEARTEADLDDRLVLFLASDDEKAKTVVSELIKDIGFTPVDTGTLREGGRCQEPGSLIYNEPMTTTEARSTLAARSTCDR